MSLVSQLRGWLTKHPCEPLPLKHSDVVKFDELGLTRITIDSDVSSMLAWSEIVAVYAFKLDLIAVDQICFAFEVAPDQPALVVTDEDGGFGDLIRLLPTYLPGFPTEQQWWGVIAQPPFATNWTQLWKKPSPEDPLKHPASS
jgi:hypothetical protein